MRGSKSQCRWLWSVISLRVACFLHVKRWLSSRGGVNISESGAGNDICVPGYVTAGGKGREVGDG